MRFCAKRFLSTWKVNKADEFVPVSAFLRVFLAGGIQLSPSRRHDNAIFGNPPAYQSLFDPVRATLAEREIVHEISSYGCIPINKKAHTGMILEPLNIVVQRAWIGRRIIVVPEEH